MVEHSHTEPAVLAVTNRRNPPIFAADRLTAALQEEDVAVFSAGSLHALECEVGHFVHMRKGHCDFILPKSRRPFNLEFTAPIT